MKFSSGWENMPGKQLHRTCKKRMVTDCVGSLVCKNTEARVARKRATQTAANTFHSMDRSWKHTIRMTADVTPDSHGSGFLKSNCYTDPGCKNNALNCTASNCDSMSLWKDTNSFLSVFHSSSNYTGYRATDAHCLYKMIPLSYIWESAKPRCTQPRK